MKLMNTKLCLMALSLAFLVQGCAVGNKYNFSDARANLNVSSAAECSLAVATLDQREHIVSGTCSPDYVGMQRAGFGNPWRVHTESGLSLAEDVTDAVSASLAQKGFKTIPVVLTYDLSQQRAIAKLSAEDAHRSILILLRKWESDTYVNIGLVYDLDLIVFGPDRSVLAEASEAGAKTIPGSFWDPPSAAKEQIPLAFKQILEQLLNDPKVVAALKQEG